MMILYKCQKQAWILVLYLLCYSFSAEATTITWTGTLDDDWNNTLNWSPTQIPTISDSVFITGNVNVTIYAGDAMECYHLTIGSKDQLLIEATASLTISNNKEAEAITAVGDVTNRGTISIDNCFRGISASSNFNNEGIINITNLSLQAIRTFSMTTFINDGKIYIDDASYGLSNTGEFINNGVYYSTNSRVRDIRQNGTLSNEDCAEMTGAGLTNSSTSSTTNKGTIVWTGNEVTLNSSATFDNTGIIVDYIGLSSTTLGYLSSSRVILQAPTGDVSIGDVIPDLIDGNFLWISSDSVYSDYDLTKSAGYYNKLSKEWTVEAGAYGQDTFYMALRANSSCIDTVEFYTQEPVLNCNDNNVFTGALSSLWDNAGNWSLGHIPMECEAVIISGYNIEISAGYAAECRSLFIIGDRDTITIGTGANLAISRGDIGIIADDNCTIVNAGTITINEVGGHGIFGSDMNISNSGTISIYDIESTGILIDSGLIDNSGTISITDSPADGMTLADGSLLNAGTIDVSHMGASGLALSGSNFENDGMIQVNDITKTGIRLLERRLYNNGQISIENVGGFGFYVSDTLDNYGDILITAGDASGLLLDGYLSNYGSIDISGNGATALSIFFGEEFKVKEDLRETKSSRTSQFLNYGYLNLDGEYGDLLVNNGVLYNDSCGVVSLNGGIKNFDVINNYGIWDQDYSNQNSSDGTFNNSGILNDQQESFNDCMDTPGCYATTGLRFGSVVGDTAYARQAYDDILQETSTSMIVDSIWYLDPDLTEKAGYYDPSTNSYTPDVSSIDYNNFYFSVAIGESGCLDTIMVNFENVVITAACDSINAITSKSPSTDWSSSRAWDLMRAPSDCDDVYINDSSINLELGAGDTAVCHTFTMITGELTIDSSAIIIIQD